MVSAKKPELSNGATKHKDQHNMSFQGKGMAAGGANKGDGKPQNGNVGGFRTDAAISGSRNQGERPLQRWVPDAMEEADGSLEASRSGQDGAPWDQFAENERRFGIKTDYRDEIYTTAINKSHPDYKQRLAAADRKAREIERSTTTNSHVQEERIADNLSKDDNGDEEDKYSGVRRQQDFPPLTSSSNKYTPPARRPPTGQPTVSGAPVDPAIISLQKPVTAEKSKAAPPSKAAKTEASTPPTATEPSATPELKPKPANTPAASTSRTASPNVKAEGVPNHTATVERDVASAFKNFATQQRKNVDQIRSAKARNDKEIKLNDLKKFADSFKLTTPVPSDLVSIIAKDPAKQKEIQEKAKRNAEEASASPAEASKPSAASSDVKAAPRSSVAAHGSSPSVPPNRQGNNRNQNFTGQHNSQSFRNDRSSPGQQIPVQQNRQPPKNLNQQLRNYDRAHGPPQMPLQHIPVHEARLPPTGPSSQVDPNFSRRSSGVASAQGGRLNPNSSEFRPSPHAATFNPNGNPSTGSSPRSSATIVEPVPVTKSLLRRKPIAASKRPSIENKFNALEHLKSMKPPPGKDWKATGGLKPAYDTPPIWKTPTEADKEDSIMMMQYSKVFENAPFPAQTMSPTPVHVVPQVVAHQHQLPFHLQQGGHMGPRASPRQPPMHLHGGQHGPNGSFNGSDDNRMVPSHSAQSFSSPRVPSSYPSPSMNGGAQMVYNQPMGMQFQGAPPMGNQRSFSQNNHFMPQQQHMPQIMMQNPNPGFMTSSGMAPGPQMIYPPGQNQFMAPGNGHPPLPGANGYPSPGRGAPMMMSQGSQQGHQQQMYGGMNPGMSPGPQYGNVGMYGQQPPNQMPMRPYPQPQFGTSPQQQMHQFQHQPPRNNHPNGNYNNKNFQQHNQHPGAPPPTQVPTGPQAAGGGDESK